MAEFDEDAHPRDEHGRFSEGGGGGGVKGWAAGEKPGLRALKAQANTASDAAARKSQSVGVGTTSYHEQGAQHLEAAKAHEAAASMRRDIAASQKDGPAKEQMLAIAKVHDQRAERHRDSASSALHNAAMEQAEGMMAAESRTPIEGKRQWVGEQVHPDKMEFRGQFAGHSNETIKDHFINGKPTDARAQFHDREIIAPAFEGKKTFEELKAEGFPGKKTAILTMGGPASGKGVVLGKLHAEGLDKTHYVHIDPDEVKTKLPEYRAQVPKSGGKTFVGAAAQVHEESSYVAKQIRDRAIEAGHHLIIDGTGGSAESFIALINRLKDKGYDVHVHHPDLGVEEGTKRALGRAERSGRFVPEPFIRKIYENIAAARDRIVDAAPHYTRYDAADGHRPVERK